MMPLAPSIWIRLHRWAGLYLALWLVLVGLTGSVLTFRGELGRWLSPETTRPTAPHPQAGLLRLDTLAACAVALAGDDARIQSIGLNVTATELLTGTFVFPDGGERSFAVDPHSGAARWTPESEGLWPVDRHNILTVITRLHEQLLLGSVGTLLLGVAALVWTIEIAIGVYLTLPATRPASATALRRSFWRRWHPAWVIRVSGSWPMLNLDLHRAGGLWFCALAFVFAWSSVYFTLPQVYDPVMVSLFGVEDEYPPELSTSRPNPSLSWRHALEIGRKEMNRLASEQGFQVIEERKIYYSAGSGTYEYFVRSSRDFGLRPNTSIFLDGDTGAVTLAKLPQNTNVITRVHYALIALHLGQWGGTAYRALVSFFGLAVAALSFTGLLIWKRKRAGRLQCRKQPPCKRN